MRASAVQITLGIGYTSKSIGASAVLLPTESYRLKNHRRDRRDLLSVAPKSKRDYIPDIDCTGAPKPNAPDYWITAPVRCHPPTPLPQSRFTTTMSFVCVCPHAAHPSVSQSLIVSVASSSRFVTRRHQDCDIAIASLRFPLSSVLHPSSSSPISPSHNIIGLYFANYRLRD